MTALISYLRSRHSFAVFVIYLRYLIGGAFVYSGFGKAMGGRFIPAGSRQLPLQGLTIDVFFDVLYRTGIWWQFLGWSQVVAGLLLLTQRWSTLGAILFLPISLNIFMITMSMNFHGTPLITGLIVLANLVLLSWDYPRLSVLLLPNRDADLNLHVVSDQVGSPHYWEALGFLIFITSIAFGNRENPPLWFILCFAEGLLGLLIRWLYKLYSRKRSLVRN